VPYELKPRDIERRVFICEQLIQRQQRKGFLHRIVTGDEKWIFYDNRRRKNTTLSPINRCHLNITAEHSWFEDHTLYLVGPKRSCLLLAAETWRFHYEQRHDKIILLHDNARPHVSKVVKKYLETLKCFTALAVFSGHCSF